jgi:phytoene synthase
MSAAVEQAYAEVQRVTRREAKNFAYGIMVLPRPKRRAIAAIYAFARAVDDVADGPLPTGEKQARLEALRGALDDPAPADAMLIALADARARFDIPREPLSALVDGGLQDTEQTRYASFGELRAYCDKVAGAVGLACLPVYGSSDLERARELGLALQLINIVRDVREDWELGRVYLPQDELAAHGVSEEDIAEGRLTPGWRSLMAEQAARARGHLAEGRRLLPSLERRSALCVGTFAGLYETTLDRIEASGFDVFAGQTRLSAPAKLGVVARGLLTPRRGAVTG